MAGASARKPKSNNKTNKGKWHHSRNNAVAWQEHPSNAENEDPENEMQRMKEWDTENEMQRMKIQELIHTARVKQAPERAAESNKPVGNGKCVRAKKAMDSYGSGACTQGLGTTYLYPTNTGEVSHGSEVREGVVWWWGEEGAYFGVPAQALLGETFCWDDI